MRAQVIAFSIVSVLGYLTWLGYHFLNALGNAFSTGPQELGPSHANAIMVAVSVLTTVSVAGAFYLSGNPAKVLALFPLLLIGMGQGWLGFSERRNFDAYSTREAAATEVRKAELEPISKDYVLVESAVRPGPFVSSFLTRDEVINELIRVDVSYNYRTTRFSIGRIDGARLEVFADRPFREGFYRNYQDAAGESLFDHFEVVVAPRANATEP